MGIMQFPPPQIITPAGLPPESRYPGIVRTTTLTPMTYNNFDISASDTQLFHIAASAPIGLSILNLISNAVTFVTLSSAPSQFPRLFYSKTTDRLYVHLGSSATTPFGWINRSSGAFTALAQCPSTSKTVQGSATDGDDNIWVLVNDTSGSLYHYKISTNTWTLLSGTVAGNFSNNLPHSMTYVKSINALYMVHSSIPKLYYIDQGEYVLAPGVFYYYQASSTTAHPFSSGSIWCPDGRYIYGWTPHGIVVLDSHSLQYWVVPGVGVLPSANFRNVLTPSGKIIFMADSNNAIYYSI